MRLVLRVGGTVETVRFIENKQERMTDDTPAMKAIQAIMIRSAQMNFEAGGRPPWAPLSGATIKRRRNQDKGSIQILRDTGYLMQSVTSAEGNSASVREAKPHTARIGTNRPGAAAHQNGFGVPERKFLLHQQQDKEDYKATWLDFVMGRGPFSGGE